MTNHINHDLLAILVLRANDALTGDDLVSWALRTLEGGNESPSLSILAGLPARSSRADAEPYFDRVLQELQIAVPGKNLLLRQYVVAIAKQIVAGSINAQLALDEIHRRVVEPLNHPSDLSAWCYLWEGNSRDLSYPPPAKSDIPKLAREYAEKYLSEVNQCHES